MSDQIVITEKTSQAKERWLAKFGQVDKWKIYLRAAMMPRIRSDHGKTSTAAA